MLVLVELVDRQYRIFECFENSETTTLSVRFIEIVGSMGDAE